MTISHILFLSNKVPHLRDLVSSEPRLLLCVSGKVHTRLNPEKAQIFPSEIDGNISRLDFMVSHNGCHHKRYTEKAQDDAR